jgi:hypothetical protein
MTSALFVVPAMLFSLRPAAAQSILAGPQPLQAPAEKMAATAMPQEFLKNRDVGTVQIQTPSKNDATNALQPWQGLLRQRQQNGPLTVRILQPEDAPSCAHIIMYQAPETDSEMILGGSKNPTRPGDVPRESSDSMPTFKGLPPCTRDFRPAIGMMFLPRRGLFLQPPLVLRPPSDQAPAEQPKKNDASGSKR